jgi:hypothetical protein
MDLLLALIVLNVLDRLRFHHLYQLAHGMKFISLEKSKVVLRENNIPQRVLLLGRILKYSHIIHRDQLKRLQPKAIKKLGIDL